MDTNMKAPLCVQTLENAAKAYPDIRGVILHSDYAEEKTMPKFSLIIYKVPIPFIFSA